MLPLDALLLLQERDTTLDRLRHRRETLPERAAVAAGEARIAQLAPRLDAVRARRDDVSREERRLDDEARSLEQRALEVEKRLYSGEVSSPRELQAMQADIEQLRRHRSDLEDEELEQMERRESLDAEVAAAESEVAEIEQSMQGQRAALAEQQSAIDEEVARERAARTEIADGVPPDLVALYERCRAQTRGVGAARLVGRTCQGCHLDIPSTEAEQIRREAGAKVAHCDNCGCILVPA
ncbi:MAG TPA: C4-type zinc ribbon domain-containing protein [Acidimicrobiia bacterium]